MNKHYIAPKTSSIALDADELMQLTGVSSNVGGNGGTTEEGGIGEADTKRQEIWGWGISSDK
ncbi:MAG: hypothetical protein MJZ43_04235 [Bacteroidaceae bacterium]|nr:hypothetical protein [Bacteroidaceae bacterium]